MSSRGRRRTSERSEISPVIFAIDWVSGVGSFVGGVDFGRPVASKQGGQRLIDEFRIGGPSVHPACVIEQSAINGRADSSAGHATIVPRSRHAGNPPSMCDPISPRPPPGCGTLTPADLTGRALEAVTVRFGGQRW